MNDSLTDNRHGMVRRVGIARFLPRQNRKTTIGLVALAAIIAVVFPFVLSTFSLSLFALFFPFAILAYSLDLIWGENRIVSFGQGAFFVGGAYIGGLILIGHPYDIVGGHTKFLEESTAVPLLNRIISGLHDPSVAGLPIVASFCHRSLPVPSD